MGDDSYPYTKILQFLKLFDISHKKDLTCILYYPYKEIL